ncbi:MAG: DUF4286 family protein [Mucinivorans sp.]
MYIVSTTFVVDPSIHGRWYEFFTTKFITTLQWPVIFTRVLSAQSDGQYTYSLQVEVPDIENYQNYQNGPLDECLDFSLTMFGEKVLHFTTLLKKIEL